MRPFDELLNSVTMYRLMVYGLGIVAVVSVIFALFGVLPFPFLSMVITLAVLTAVCYCSNRLMAILFEVPVNSESWLITALILFFILPPASGFNDFVWIAVAGLVAMASKFVLVWRKKHILNPAAVAAVALGVSGFYPASWWIGTAALLPFTALLGLVIIHKIRRYTMFTSFLLAALAAMLLVGLIHGRGVLEILVTAFTAWPLVFFGTIMLTEPATAPPRKYQRIWYGVIVGALFASQQHIGPVASTPEVVLVIGNLLAYIVRPKYRLTLRLKQKTKLSEHVYDFVFIPNRRPTFQPGQYLEWTLPHGHTDGRGNRRTFTIASSPTEEEIHIGVKFYQPSSSFKTALKALAPGEAIIADQLAGDFVLPTDPSRKLAWIAGGIGITPFRSMLKYLVDTGQQRDIVLFYAVSDSSEVSYRETVMAAEQLGLRVVPVLTSEQPARGWNGHRGKITSDLIQQELPDCLERVFYLSGPNAMVRAHKQLLRSIGVKNRQIMVDYFPGY